MFNTIYMTVNFDPKTRNLFLTDHLDLYSFDSGCHEVSKQLSSRHFSFREEDF